MAAPTKTYTRSGREITPRMNRGFVTLEGVTNMTKKLKLLEQNFNAKLLATLDEVAQEIIDDAKENYVPEDDNGYLRKSGRVVRGYYFGNLARVELWFGGGKSAPYALAIHEHLSEHSPASWQNHANDIKWTSSKIHVGPKYLERPLRAKALTLPREIGKKMNIESLASFRTNYKDSRDEFGRFGFGEPGTPSYSLGSGEE